MANVVKTILVVDDNKDERTVLCDILTAEGFKVLAAENGQKALEVLAKNSVDMMITDRAMPVMDGLALLAQLRDRKITLPVIVVSGYGEEGLWGEAIGLGAKDYLVKPASPAEVIKLVRKYLAGGKK